MYCLGVTEASRDTTQVMLVMSLRARRDTTQVMLGVSLRAGWDTTLVVIIHNIGNLWFMQRAAMPSCGRVLPSRTGICYAVDPALTYIDHWTAHSGTRRQWSMQPAAATPVYLILCVV